MRTKESKVRRVGNDGTPGVVGQNVLRLLAERPELGVSELARRAGFGHASKVTELTKGRSKDCTVDTQQRLAKALGVDPNDLTLTREEVAQSEKILLAFERSSEAKRLIPPYSEIDAMRLKARRAHVVREGLPPRGIRWLVRQLRAANGEPDSSD